MIETDKRRADVVAEAIDLLGVTALAHALDRAERTVYTYADGSRRIGDRELMAIRHALIDHRQRTGDLIRLIRAHEPLTL